jgi:predicted RNA-binding Zn ribbon-like protein
VSGQDIDTTPTGLPAFGVIHTVLPVAATPHPLSLDLANTLYVHRGSIHDGIVTVEGLNNWLSRIRGRLNTPLSSSELDDVREADVLAADELRAAIRALAGAQIEGQPLDPDAAAKINHRVSLIPRWTELAVASDGRVSPRYRSTAAGVPAAIAEIAADAVHLFTVPQRREAVAACQAPGCISLFLRDEPDRRWCSARCGHRAQAISTGSLIPPSITPPSITLP